MTKLEMKLYNWALTRSIVKASKKIVLPGFQGLSLYVVSRFFFKEIRNTKLTERAAAVTYNFLMALAPTMLFLFSLIPYLPLKGVQKTILITLKMVTPNMHIYDTASKVVVDFMTVQRRDILSFGVLLTLFFSSNGIMGLMRSFDRSQAIYKKRTGLSRRWTAMKLTFVMMALSIVALALFIMQINDLNGLILSIFHNIVAVKLISFLILILIIFLAISIIYRYGPSLTHQLKFVTAGSVFATLLSVIATAAFFYVVNHIINYNKIYGSIGTLIAFMVWVWLNTLVILIGYELNISILLGNISREKDVTKKNDNQL